MNNILPLKNYSTIHALYPDDEVKRGETWIYHNSFDNYINTRRHESLKNWWINVLYHAEDPMERWAMIFWENFLGIQSSKLTYATRSYRHYDIIRNFALGNYREMLCEIILMQTALYFVKKKREKNIPVTESLLHFILRNYVAGPEYIKYTSGEKIKRLKKLLNEWNLIIDTIQSQSKSRPEYSIYDYNSFINHSAVREFIPELNAFMGKLLDYTHAGQHLAKKLFIWRYHRIFNEQELAHLILPASGIFHQQKHELHSLVSNIYNSAGSVAESPAEFVIRLAKKSHEPGLILSGNHYEVYERLQHLLPQLGQQVADIPDNYEWVDYLPAPVQQKWLGTDMMSQREISKENILRIILNISSTI
jgi:hypothetical protein